MMSAGIVSVSSCLWQLPLRLPMYLWWLWVAAMALLKMMMVTVMIMLTKPVMTASRSCLLPVQVCQNVRARVPSAAAASLKSCLGKSCDDVMEVSRKTRQPARSGGSGNLCCWEPCGRDEQIMQSPVSEVSAIRVSSVPRNCQEMRQDSCIAREMRTQPFRHHLRQRVVSEPSGSDNVHVL